MKNNKFLMIVGLCLSLSATISFGAQNQAVRSGKPVKVTVNHHGQYIDELGRFTDANGFPSTVPIYSFKTDESGTLTNVDGGTSTTPKNNNSWYNMPGKWFQWAKSTIKGSSLDLSQYSYTQLTQALVGLIVLAKTWGWSKDYIMGVVNIAFDSGKAAANVAIATGNVAVSAGQTAANIASYIPGATSLGKAAKNIAGFTLLGGGAIAAAKVLDDADKAEALEETPEK